MRWTSFEGIVIKRLNWRETDKIVTFFTREHGKLVVLAKGVRGAMSKRGGTLELFNRVAGRCVTGRGDREVLAEVKLVDGYTGWRAHLGRIALAYQICEAVDKLTAERQPHPEAYGQLCANLNRIGGLGEDWVRETDEWMVELIQALGFWPAGKSFTGSITEYIEDLAATRLHSPRLLLRLKHPPRWCKIR